MPTILPPWPHVLFAIGEPITLIAGWLAVYFDTYNFVADQTPNPHPPTLHPSTTVVAYQLGNMYLGLLFMCVGILYTTSEPKIIRNYLIVWAIIDIGHVYATYMGMGWAALVDVKSWNGVAWGNIAGPLFLLVNRIAYLLGLFGYAKAPNNKTKTP